ncbi:MAG: TetR/AcrR family transcriptional regulator [Aureispira sp.]
MNAAEGLFHKYGVRSVTMADIARDLGMSKKTLYVHVENKRDLVQQIVQRHIQEDKKECYSIVESSENALEALLKINVYAQTDMNDMNPSLLFDLKKYHRPVWELLDNFHRKEMLQMVINNLQEGVDEGLYRTDFNIELIARIHVSLMLILSDVDFFPLDQFPLSVRHGEFTKYHINAIVSDKGRRLLQELGDHIDPMNDIH